jgi:hypothetical protein
VTILFHERALEAMGDGRAILQNQFGEHCRLNESNQLQLKFTNERWTATHSLLDEVLEKMVQGWKLKTSKSAESPAEQTTSDVLV